MANRTVYVKPRMSGMDWFAVVFCLGVATLIVLNLFYPRVWAALTGTAATTVEAPASIPRPTAYVPQPAPAPQPTAQPAPAPVVLPVANDAPAPVVQPAPAQEAPAAPAPVVIIHRVEQSGAQVVTGSGACKAARSVARRCGK